MSRRSVSIFSVTFLDLMTNMTGAVMILMLLALKDNNKKPCPSIAHQGQVFYDRESGKVFGNLAPNSAAVAKLDGILVTVTDFQPFPKAGAACPPCICPPCPGKDKCDRIHCDDPGCSKGAVINRQECAIALSTQAPACQGKDAYTVKVSVAKAGSCATTWTDGSGRSWAYDSEVTLGPYPITQGSKTITVWDSQNPALRRSASVSPPASCSEYHAPPPPPPAIGYVPAGRRAILHWDNEKSNLNLVVKKGRDKVYGGARKKDWGIWYDDKAWFVRGMEEGVRFLEDGRYEIYVKNVTGNSGPPSQKFKIAFTNSIGVRESRELSFELSQDSGETLVAEIEISRRGIIIINTKK